VRDLLRRWWDVLWHPRAATFDRQRAAASWPDVWLGLLLLGIVEALGVAYLIYGPNADAGYSSLPVGPKLHLPRTPLLPLAALGGSIAQFFVFSGLLYLSARLLGGRGSFTTQSYLLALVWVPLLAVSDIAELIPGVGALLGMLVRAYALALCALALASAHHAPLRRAWMALLLPVAGGLLLGLVVLATLGPWLWAVAGIR
jgi:hypothetical protein